VGYKLCMTESTNNPVDGIDVPAENIESRADDLLPEELAVGSADPAAQAAAILLESEERTADPAAGL
jgi:hypothetical protein